MTQLRPLLLGAILALGAAGAAEAQVVAIRGARIVPVEGEEIPQGTVLIRDGLIEKVGARVQVPYDATVIDGSGKVLFPGMVLAHTSSGLDRANESLPATPFLDVADALDPSSYAFEAFLREGVTTVHVIQGEAQAIAGVGRVVQPLGLTVDAMTVEAPSGLKLSLGRRRDDPIQQRAQLREAFAKLLDHVEERAEARYAEEHPDAPLPPVKARAEGRALVRTRDVKDELRNLYRLVQGELDAYVACERAMDVPYALNMAQEMGFLERTVFVLGGEAHKAVDLLAAAGRPVILPPDLTWREVDPETGREEETFVATAFARAGVPFALQVNPSSSFAERFLWFQAARCVREGVDRATALAAITLVPARILGLADRVGSIAPGKVANLLVLDGDPLSAQTHVEAVLLEGRVVYERENDPHMRRLLGQEPPVREGDEPGLPHLPHEGEDRR